MHDFKPDSISSRQTPGPKPPRPATVKCIHEIFNISYVEYVTLYDHVDNYEKNVAFPLGSTRVFYTDTIHWMQVRSTCMSFLCKVATIKKDLDIFYGSCTSCLADDYFFWSGIQNRYRKTVGPIPGLATHGETAYMFPCINWGKYIKEAMGDVLK